MAPGTRRQHVVAGLALLLALSCRGRKGPDPVASLRERCNPMTGLPSALPVCTPSSPCTNLLHETITSPEQPPPTCAPKHARSFQAHDGPPLAWSDPSSGVATRHACVFRPRRSGATRAPLVIFVHGSGGDADNVYDMTDLRRRAETSTIGAPGSEPGFLFASMHGRNLHFPAKSFDGSHWDDAYRDLTTSTSNPDVRALDHVIDTLAAEVDPKRIYVVGWSNGATFAHLYGVARSTHPTPGGRFVAAVIGYAGGDPFNGLYEGERPSCALDPYPRADDLAILDVHRTCDSLVACDEAQRAKFGLPPGNPVQPWLDTFATRIGRARPTELLLDAQSRRATSCMAASECSEARGLEGHLAWPREVEPEMLEFLASHPRK